MLVVLQDFLPSLELAINANLAQVVEYEIKFELIKKTGDKLELEIFVIDEKGQRQVKSLSGGQKTVLKLVWILSVATMMQSKFLFMDETINNLDTEAIAKIAELIKNFVAYHDMKYYVVTHATQIQEMGIWTKTVEI
jgi:DNA repair exonuclease SbcCD ATPase subunit